MKISLKTFDETYELSLQAMEDLFQAIKHGDEQHQKWLRDELIKYASSLSETIFEAHSYTNQKT